MLKKFTIGGVHPPENKISAGAEIKTLALPKQVIIPLSQHIGAPAKALVKKGDKVLAGQLIAEAGGFVSANIHSSVSGTVFSVADFKDAQGLTKQAVIIDVEGDDWMESINKDTNLEEKIDDISKEEIIEKIKGAGIVGLGGATFPAHVKLCPPPNMKAELLIINAVECEPYLTSDHQLMLEKSREILVGIRLLMKAISVDRAVIGIENNKPDAIEVFEELCASEAGIEVAALRVQYPQGGEKQLIEAITGKCVPSGALPIATGAVVHNVGTSYAVYEAVMKNKTLFERVVTITGKSVKNPGNYLCRIGTPMSQLIEAAGGLPEDTAKVIAGGPMMGKAVVNIDSPITKGTSGVLIINEKEARRPEARNCIRCGKCVDACPMGLEPYLFMTLCEMHDLEALEANKITDCIECGCCTFSCPAARPLLDYVRIAKADTMAMIRSRKS